MSKEAMITSIITIQTICLQFSPECEWNMCFMWDIYYRIWSQVQHFFFFHNLIYFLFGGNRWHDLCMHDIKIHIIFVNNLYFSSFSAVSLFSIISHFSFKLMDISISVHGVFFCANYFCQMTNLFLSIFQVRIINDY